MRQRSTSRPAASTATAVVASKTYRGTTLRPRIGDIVRYTPPGSSGWEPSPVTGVALHTIEDADFDMDAALASPDRFPPCWPEVQVSGVWVVLSLCTLIRCAPPASATPAAAPQVRTRVRTVVAAPQSDPVPDTPLFREWRSYKKLIPDGALLMVRLGDFFEFFFTDAVTAAQTLRLALTRRNGVPMAGIPHHSAALYVHKLHEAGYAVYAADYPEGYVHLTTALKGQAPPPRSVTGPLHLQTPSLTET